MPSEHRPHRASALFALALLAALAAAAPPARAGVNVWTPIGPDGGEVTALAIDPATPSTLYAGTRGGVFKSTDFGASWSLSSRGLGTVVIDRLALDPRQPSHLFATGFDFGSTRVFRSFDGAATWQALPGALTNGITSLAADLGSPRGLLAVGFDGQAWHSADGGQTWQRRGRQIRDLSLLADPLHPGAFYGSTSDGRGVLYSADGGATWSARNAGLPQLEGTFVQLALDPEAPATLYATTRDVSSGRLFVSRDSGGHWQEDGPGGLFVATGPGGAVYTGIARSLDHGATWTALPTAPGLGQGLAVSPASGATVYTHDVDGIFASTDGAASWRLINRGITATEVSAVAVRPALPTVILVGVYNSPFLIPGIFRGRPSGRAWQLTAEPYGILGDATSSQQLVFDPADPSVVYARLFSVSHIPLFLRSTDGGLSWEAVALPATAPACSALLLTLAAGPGALYAGFALPTTSTCAQTCGLFKSVDQGRSWTCLSLRAPGLRSLAVAPSSAGAVLYATEEANLWRSGDAGKTWTLQNRGWQRVAAALSLVAVDPTRTDTLYLTSDAGLLKSTDGARTFRPAGRGLPVDPSFPGFDAREISEVLIDPTDPDTLYVGRATEGVYRSVDGGAHWSLTVGGLRGFTGALALDPLHPATLYAGTPENGVYTITFNP